MSNNENDLFFIGDKYFVRTVTMHIVGRLVSKTDSLLMFEEASWVADSGRWNNALKTGELDEVEPFIDNVIVSRGSIVDATKWRHDLPRGVK